MFTAILSFLTKLLEVVPDFFKRRSERKEKQFQSNAAKEYEQNEKDITKLYRDSK